MLTYKQRALNFLEIEWGTYVERFNRWPAEEGLKRVNVQGYEQFRDMLAHVLAWWEEGMPIILAVAEGREYARKKYDFDAFNAEAVAKYKDWDEAEFLVYFEKTRQKAVADLKSMNEAAWGIGVCARGSTAFLSIMRANIWSHPAAFLFWIRLKMNGKHTLIISRRSTIKMRS
jgi:hypothetical protein